MKIVIASLLLPLTCFSEVHFSSTPLVASEYADSETETNIVFETSIIDENKWTFTIEHQGSWRNNFQVEFGTDSNNNGALDLEEREFVAGWDCLEWIVDECNTPDGVHVYPVNDGNDYPSKRKLTWTIWFDGNKQPNRLESDVLGIIRRPTAFFKSTWNRVRLVSRGLYPIQGHVEYEFSKDGLKVIIR